MSKKESSTLRKLFKSKDSTEKSATSDKEVLDSPKISSPRKDHQNSEVVQNFRLIWLDSNIDRSNPDCCNSLTRLRRVVNCIDTFTDPDQCIDFLKKINDEKVFLVMSGYFSQTNLPIFHNISQIDSIFIFCGNKSRYEHLTKDWFKLKGVYTHIDNICDSLYQAAHQCDHDLMPMSFLSANNAANGNANFNKIDHSFMYTQLFKEVLLEIDNDDDKQAIEQLADYCKERYKDNQNEIKTIEKFQHEYHAHTPIWWYTLDCFVYRMINRALCTREVNIILKMGFFIRDLHRDIEKLHSKQIRKYHDKSLTVYRGQRFTNANFERMKKMEGGLISFNNFLSTSVDENVAINFVRQNIKKPDSVGVLFRMTIDLTVDTAPFASIDEISHFSTEKEVLFSTHTVFRIGHITQFEQNESIWRVNLNLTNDTDSQLTQLTDRTREEMGPYKGWHRLPELLIKLGELDKAEEVCKMLMKKNPNDQHNPVLCHQLGQILRGKGNYEQAVGFYNESTHQKK